MIENRKIIIATHGELAAGMKNTIKLLTGFEDIVGLCCFCEGLENPEKIRDAILEYLQGAEKVVVFTDLKGGSVNRILTQLIREHENLYVISGANLAVVLEFVCSSEAISTLIPRALEAGKNDLSYMNLLLGGA